MWFLFLLILISPLPAFPQEPDWIPVGSIPQGYERTLRSTAVLLGTGDPRLQMDTLRLLEKEISLQDPLAARAATPLLVDVARREHRIVTYPKSYQVPPQTRAMALRLLAGLGTESAIEQLHDSIRHDEDETVRSYAAQLLSVSDAPSLADMTVVLESLSRARALRTGENEIFQYLSALEQMLDSPWMPVTRFLVSELLLVADGPYSSGTRSKASMLLESLIDR